MTNNHFFKNQPDAHPESIVVFGQARFTLLTDRMIRLEWSEDGRFEDRATLSAVNRRLPPVKFTKKNKGQKLTITTDKITLTYTGDGDAFTAKNLQAEFKLHGKTARWHYGLKDSQNLGGTTRTLDGTDGDMRMIWEPKNDGSGEWTFQGKMEKIKIGDGLISRKGWAVMDDSSNIVLDETIVSGRSWVTARPEGKRQDLYLLAYGHDYKEALRDAAMVFGRQPLPPRFTLGYWYSRYWAYTDKEIEEIVGQFNRMGVPFDVMVIDMDWHLLGWTGYTWDRAFFPDPAETLRWLKEQGLKITLNLHPADGVGKHEEQFDAICRAMNLDPAKTEKVPFDITDPRFMEAYFKILHHPQEDQGVDFWWLDWQQGQNSKLPGLDPLPWLNQLHWEDMERRDRRKRPLCFSRFGGLGAGRFPIGFSGDTTSSWKSLAYQPYFTANASNVLYGYWSHDIGGHMAETALPPELYARWVQFGIFSPIVRTHAGKDTYTERRFWTYPEPYGPVKMDCVRRRYEMVPYIYSENRRGLESGLSLLRPMYYDWPEAAEAYRAKAQYMFGGSMLVTPVVQPADQKDEMAEAKVWLPPGEWWDTVWGAPVKGGVVLKDRYLLDEIPVFVRPGAVIPGQQLTRRLLPGGYEHLLLTVYPGDAGRYDLYEDDGVSQDYLEGGFATIPCFHEQTKSGRVVTIAPAQGLYKKFPKRRSLEIRLPGVLPPKTVTVGRRALDWSYRTKEEGWSYDGDKATLLIRVADFDATKGLEVRIMEDYSLPQEAVWGLPGLMARLLRVGEYNNLVSPFKVLHLEERLASRLAQTGNRLSRRPESLREELAALRRDLPRLPRVLQEFQSAYTKTGFSKGRDLMLQQARNILQSALKQMERRGLKILT